MGKTVTEKILAAHLVAGEMKQGEEISHRSDPDPGCNWNHGLSGV
jgi:hypothetical protein